MKIDSISLREIRMRLKAPFETSFGVTQDRRILLVEVVADGVSGWVRRPSTERWDVMRRPGSHRAGQQAGEIGVPDFPFLAEAAHHPGLVIGDELERDVRLRFAPADRLPGPDEPSLTLVEEKLARRHPRPLGSRHLTFGPFRAAVNSPKFDAVEDVDSATPSVQLLTRRPRVLLALAVPG